MATNYKVISTDALIAKFQHALNNNWGYIWGTAGEKWTAAKQEQLNMTTDSDRKLGREFGKKWIGHIVADCSGLFSWAFRQLGSYMYHGSDTMWKKYCVNQGSLANGKRTDGRELKPGTAVFTYGVKNRKRNHVGLYIGNGWVIEAAGTKEGVIKTKVTLKKWVEWGELKYVNYDSSVPVTTDQGIGDAAYYDPNQNGIKIPSYPTIRRGTSGDLVVQLQRFLAKDGSSLAIDGIFGPGTESAVRAFQKRHGLTADGIVGPKTWAALLKVK